MNVVQQAVVVRAPFRHGIHLFLDLITFGAWLPIHLLCFALH